MEPAALHAFSDELEKISGLRDLLSSIADVFRSKDTRVEKRVEYQFSPKAGRDKWEKLIRNARDQKFVDRLAAHQSADDKLVLHAQSMHDLSRGKPVAKIQSGTAPGKTYEIRKMPSGLGCQCNDWRYKGSVNPGYECKHIRAFKAGKVAA